MTTTDYNKNKNLRQKKKEIQSKRIQLKNTDYIKVHDFVEAEKAIKAYLFCQIIFKMAPQITVPKTCYVLGVWTQLFNYNKWCEILPKILTKNNYSKINGAKDIKNLDDLGTINDWQLIKEICVCNI